MVNDQGRAILNAEGKLQHKYTAANRAQLLDLRRQVFKNPANPEEVAYYNRSDLANETPLLKQNAPAILERQQRLLQERLRLGQEYVEAMQKQLARLQAQTQADAQVLAQAQVAPAAVAHQGPGLLHRIGGALGAIGSRILGGPQAGEVPAPSLQQFPLAQFNQHAIIKIHRIV